MMRSASETMTSSGRAWAEIDLGKLERNYLALKVHVGGSVGVVGVVKANAYGHGDIPVAKRLEALGVSILATATVAEAATLREAGITFPILVMGGCLPGQERDVVRNDVSAAAFTLQALEDLSKEASEAGKTIRYHVKVDSGMGRLGIKGDNILEFLGEASKLKGVELEGVFTHFASADESGEDEYTEAQMNEFRRALAQVEAAGYRVRYRHAANSAGTLYHPESWLDLVRPGISLYGINPSGDRGTIPLEPVLSFMARTMFVKKVPPGTSIGYGRTFVSQKESVVATLGVGYADGLNRLLSNKGKVIIHGQYAPIVGNISMDLTTVDVTDVPGVQVGDEAIIIGRRGALEITAWDIARLIGSIPYEVLTSIGGRVTRVYVG